MKKGLLKLIIFIVLVLIILAGSIGFFIYASTRPVQVDTTAVGIGEVKDIVSASGKIEANRTVQVMAPATDKVTEVLVKEGDTVAKDQELVRLSVAGAVKSPMAGKVVKVDVQVDQMVSGTTSTPNYLGSTTTTPGTTSGTSTTPGTDTTTATTPGTSTTTTQPDTTNTQDSGQGVGTVLMTVADMDPTYLLVNVDETDISKIKTGQTADIMTDSYPKKKIKGEIADIGLMATATQTGGTAFPVKIKVTEDDGAVLRIGMSADADIIINTYPDAIRIPVQAVVSSNGKDVVYVVVGSRAEKRDVKVGLIYGDFYEVKDGVTNGEYVVIKGLEKLKDNNKVKVKANKK
jgi:multidrug efflux pump subunit AcrA (membrane-fusion protein)